MMPVVLCVVPLPFLPVLVPFPLVGALVLSLVGALVLALVGALVLALAGALVFASQGMSTMNKIMIKRRRGRAMAPEAREEELIIWPKIKL